MMMIKDEEGRVDIAHVIAQAFASVFPGVGLLDSNNILWKLENGIWTGKPSVQTKDLRSVWFEECLPEDIDTRYYNLDGTYKQEI